MPSEYRYNQVDKFVVCAELTQPMRIGNANGDAEALLVHPVTGRPFVQAAGIAGTFRSYIARKDQEMAKLLFGPEQGDGSELGRLKFTDGILYGAEGGCPKIELRPHIKINAETGTVSSGTIKGTDQKAGHKFNLEYIGAGAFLQFSVYLFGRAEENNYARGQLLEAFAALHEHEILIGGKKSNGCGQVKITKLWRKSFDLTKPEGRRTWTGEDALSEKDYEDIKDTLPGVINKQATYRITVSGESDSLLVKCVAVAGAGENVPDEANIQNVNKEYIIPGSSFKGVIRNRMEQIAGYLSIRYPENAEEYKAILRNTFGIMGEKGVDGKAGNIRFFDTVVRKKEENNLTMLQRRIHIDKFTGGVMSGGLFSEENVSGKVTFVIDVLDRNFPQQTCGLLILALRDLALEQVSVGSGYGIGKGIIHVDSIEVLENEGGKVAKISMTDQRIKDDDKILEHCLFSLREVS